MISVITCSMNPTRLAALRAAYSSALGAEEWELISIPDAKSRAEGYNRAVSSSRGDVLIFTHDHVIEFLSPELPQRLAAHLQNFDLVGTQGTRLLTDANWESAGYLYLFGQTAKLHDAAGIQVLSHAIPTPAVGKIQALDGVWMVVRRSVFSRLAFDAVTFDGFDLCELDFSFAAYLAGFRLGVACDIAVLEGNTAPPVNTRDLYAMRFNGKWGPRLARASGRVEQRHALVHPNRQEAAAAMAPPYWQDATGPREASVADVPIPMISLIVCSRNAAQLSAAKASYSAVMGDAPWEFIGIENPPSLAAGYIQGIAQSRGELLVFSHDDVQVLSPEFPQRLARHLRTYDIVGVAGTLWLYNAGWSLAGQPFIIGQVAYPYPDGRICVTIFGVPRKVVGNIQALDGLFMAARRSVFSKVGFDAQTFDGFHFYDLDFSYAAYCAGLKIAVANDIHVLHGSTGDHEGAWRVHGARFRKKWDSKFPTSFRQVFPVSSNIILVSTRQELSRIMNAPWLDEE